MRLIDKDKLMEILCQHCDSHIEMCGECGMREIIESVPSAWISVKDRLPEESGTYLTVDMDTEIPYMRTLDYSAKWHGWNCCNYLDDEKQAKAYEMNVTHWMPLPDAPEVDDE